MSKRPPKPENVPWTMPYLIVQDVSKATDFYQKAFGFELIMSIPGPDGKITHAEVKWHDQVIMCGAECDENPAKSPVTSGIPSPVSLYFYVEDVDAAYQQAIESGATSVEEPIDMFWGDRMARVTDPDGHGWSLATNIADFDPANIPS